MIWPLLAVFCAAAAFRRPRMAVAFLLCLGMVVALDSVNFPFNSVHFLAIYAGIGALCFFCWDGLAGAVLCLIGLFHGLQVLGFIDLQTRQIVGEFIFSLGLFAGAILGTPTATANRRFLVSTGFGVRSLARVGARGGKATGLGSRPVRGDDD